MLVFQAICGEIDNFELLLVDFGGFIARNGRPLTKGSGTSCIMCSSAYDIEGGALASGGNECALHEDLVLAFDCERRVLLDGLEQHWKSGRTTWRIYKKGLYLVLVCPLRVLSCPSLDGRRIAIGHIRLNAVVVAAPSSNH